MGVCSFCFFWGFSLIVWALALFGLCSFERQKRKNKKLSRPLQECFGKVGLKKRRMFSEIIGEYNCSFYLVKRI